MLLLIFACSSPEKLAYDHATLMCEFLADCQLLDAFEYTTSRVECLEDEESNALARTRTEDDASLLEACTNSIEQLDCSAAYEQEYFLSEACTTWLEATDQQVPDQE